MTRPDYEADWGPRAINQSMYRMGQGRVRVMSDHEWKQHMQDRRAEGEKILREWFPRMVQSRSEAKGPWTTPSDDKQKPW